MKPIVVLIGDSIRMGYMATVAELIGDKVDLRWPEPNCADTRRTLANLDEWVIAQQPQLVHLNCGLHDIKLDPASQTHQVPPDEYEANLRTIFTRITTETPALLVWATTTPVIEERHNAVKDFGRFNRHVDAYNAIAARLAAELGLPVNDLCADLRAADLPALLTPDGVHYTPEGKAFLGERVAACITRLLGD